VSRLARSGRDRPTWPTAAQSLLAAPQSAATATWSSRRSR